MNYEATLLTTEHLIYREIGTDNVSSKTLDSLRSFYDESMYFILKIFPDSEVWDAQTNDFIASYSQNYNTFKENLEILLYRADQYAFVKVNNDTIYPSLFHCERGFELVPEQRLLLAYPKKSSALKSGDVSLIFVDEVFQNGVLKFHFANELL
ncbi:MAG: hypothetical protein WEC59_04895 [Salibacteraceae bacterium]